MTRRTPASGDPVVVDVPRTAADVDEAAAQLESIRRAALVESVDLARGHVVDQLLLACDPGVGGNTDTAYATALADLLLKLEGLRK